MSGLTFVCWGLMAVAATDGAPPAASGSKAYDEARAQLGRGAEGQLRLALWCEAHGLNAEKLRHLATAALGDPASATARALMGLVDDGGKWRDPQAVAARVKADEAMSKALLAYNARRDKVPNTADAQWKLALWCEENGLKDEAAAHLTSVVRLDPKRDTAWRRLGYSKQRDGRWLTAEQIAAERTAREAQNKADTFWKTRLEQWKEALARPVEHDAADRALDGVTDARAVPAVWRTFVSSKHPDQPRAVAMLGRIDGPVASHALALLAVRGNSPEVRRAAKETLRRRDPREFVDVLVGLLGVPLTFEFKLIGADHFGSPGFVRVRRGDTLFEQVYTVDESFDPNIYNLPLNIARTAALNTDPMPYFEQNLAYLTAMSRGPAINTQGLPAALAKNSAQTVASLGAATRVDPALANQAMGQAQMTASSIQAMKAALDHVNQGTMANYRERATVQNQRINDVVAQVRTLQATTVEVNERTEEALHDITGTDPGPGGGESWRKWWTDQQGYSYEPPRPKDEGPVQVVFSWVHYSCFAAHTPVKTIGGSTPIEAVKVGDRLLTQDPDTGRLSFQPVVAVYHNKPSATLRIAFEGGSTIVATGIHRFWKAGYGWVMARDLKPGDPIRTVGGLDRVKRVTDDAVQPVFNLEVARGRSFFVGEGAALVHDNSLVDPVTTPFDAVPELAAAVSR